MRVVCDNCGASYKIPETKLTKEVNKATCRKCGHAIYIRRAAAGVAAAVAPIGEERTLITSSADLQQRGQTGGFDEMAPRRQPDPASQESTMPRAEAPRPEPVSGRGGPSLSVVHDDRGASPPTLSPPSSHSFAPPSGGLDAAPDMPTARNPDRPAFMPRPVPAAEHVVERPRGVPVEERPPVERPAPARAEPARPSPAAERAEPRMPSMTTPTYDPRGDLTFAVFSSLVAVFGVGILLANTVIGSTLVTAAGAFFAILGCIATVLVLLTGGRGTKRASWAVSVLGGFVLAGGGAALAVAAGTMLPGFSTPPPVAAVKPAPEPVVAPPVPPPAAPVVAEPVVAEPVAAVPVTPPPEPVAAVTPPPVAAPPPEPVKTASSSDTRKSSSSSSSSSSSRSSKSSSSSSPSSSSSSERIAPASSSTSSTASTKTATSSSPSTSSSTSASVAPTTSSSSSSSTSSASSAATGVSTTVIDTMMRSNKAVKGCFITEKTESGTLPSGVKVKFTIQPSGKVSSAAIPSGDYQGTAFDSCLSGAVKSITFPPFDGDPVTMTYPFKL